jgi:hypothetical protein
MWCANDAASEIEALNSASNHSTKVKVIISTGSASDWMRNFDHRFQQPHHPRTRSSFKDEDEPENLF